MFSKMYIISTLHLGFPVSRQAICSEVSVLSIARASHGGENEAWPVHLKMGDAVRIICMYLIESQHRTLSREMNC